MQETSSEISIQKTGEATSDLIGNKIADKVASVSKKSTKNYKRMKQMWTQKELLLKKDTYLQKKDNKLLMN